ncbi:glycosyltransferase [Halopseudomonas aestusnigri]|uniref:glycosyltransferase n=1 Tax=Halopseudomonas aestusnigri TaxID=857252 RepID=UPI003002D19E
MERLNWHMADELSKYADVRVIGPSGSAAQKPDNVHIAEAPLKPLLLFLIVTFFKGLWAALRWRPDTILAGSGLTAPIAWILGKLAGARSAAYLHGFDITVDHAIYRRLWRPTFKRLNHVIVNSTPTKQLALDAGVNEAQLSIVFPGVSMPEAPQPAERIAEFREKHSLTGKKILLSVGRLTTRKGLREFVELSLPAVVNAEPDAMLVVVGEAPRNSLGAGIQTVESIQAAAAKAGVGANIIFLGVITDPTELATAYEAADVHVFPVRHIPDDPEGFGMVAIEAAAHGLPTVAFETGGVVDAIEDKTSGYLITAGDYDQFSGKVIASLNTPKSPYLVASHTKRFEWEEFGRSVRRSIFNNDYVPLEKTRKAHASTDIASRIPKAKKIELLLDLPARFGQREFKMLEVGCGSGGIIHYFGTHRHLNCEATGVDVNDNRQIKAGYEFVAVDSVELPFSDASFDVVITNHVIEHVGNRDSQLKHLQEINRVMVPGGVCYLAVPNRWMITEPHYNLKFLSWLPKGLRSTYLRLARKGEYYDCEPLQLFEIESLLKETNSKYQNISLQATKITLALEKPGSYLEKLVQRAPKSVLEHLKPLIPTLIYLVEK